MTLGVAVFRGPNDRYNRVPATEAHSRHHGVRQLIHRGHDPAVNEEGELTGASVHIDYQAQGVPRFKCTGEVIFGHFTPIAAHLQIKCGESGLSPQQCSGLARFLSSASHAPSPGGAHVAVQWPPGDHHTHICVVLASLRLDFEFDTVLPCCDGHVHELHPPSPGFGRPFESRSDPRWRGQHQDLRQ